MVLGVVLIVLGVAFIMLSLVAAARMVLLESQKAGPAGLGDFDPEAWAKFLHAVAKVIKIAPQWLLLAAVGAGFVAWGGAMLD